MTALLEVQDVHKRFGGTYATRGVSLTLHEGGGKRVLTAAYPAGGRRATGDVVHQYELDASLGVFVRQSGPTYTVALTVRLEAQP